MDCVSVFDYRNIHDDEPRKFIYKCKPTDPLIDGKGIAIFIIKQSLYTRLITSENLKIEDLSQMVVPHIEAGYPGAIKLDNIEEVIFVTMTQNRIPLAGALLKL